MGSSVFVLAGAFREVHLFFTPSLAGSRVDAAPASLTDHSKPQTRRRVNLAGAEMPPTIALRYLPHGDNQLDSRRLPP